MAILTDLKDPRVGMVTVTFVEVTPDLRQAKVHVSIMGTEAQEKLSLAGLRNSAGFLQSKIAKRIDTRYTPRLEFVLDPGVKNSLEVARILREVLPPTPSSDTSPVDETSADDLPDDTEPSEDTPPVAADAASSETEESS